MLRPYVHTCVCAYVTFVTRFKFTCKIRCKFTSALLLQLITFIPSGLETLYDTYLHQDLLMYGTVAPGSCPWAGLAVGVGASVYCGHISSFHMYQGQIAQNQNMQFIVFYTSAKMHQNIPYCNRATGQNSCFMYGRCESSRLLFTRLPVVRRLIHPAAV